MSLQYIINFAFISLLQPFAKHMDNSKEGSFIETIVSQIVERHSKCIIPNFSWNRCIQQLCVFFLGELIFPFFWLRCPRSAVSYGQSQLIVFLWNRELKYFKSWRFILLIVKNRRKRYLVVMMISWWIFADRIIA